MNITDVCNMALSCLGKGRIASIDEQSEQARQCKLFYSQTKKRLLRDYSWGFAKRVEQLARLSTNNPFWGFSYAYPNKCECVRRIFCTTDVVDSNGTTRKVVVPKIEADQRDKYEIYMVSDNIRAIGCDVEDAWMEYTYDIDDLNVCSSDFIDSLVHMLAYNMALALTGNMQLKTSEYQQAMSVLNRAKFTNEAEAHNKPDYYQGYYESRF